MCSQGVLRIELPFDKLLFDGGLKQHGHLLRKAHGHEIFTIRRYADLEPLLGEGWHIRGLNDSLDFCYVNLHTVQFYLHQRKDIVEYTPEGTKTIHGGLVLIFRFVRMDGVHRQWESVSLLA